MPPIFEFRDEAHRRSAKWVLLAISGSVAVLLSISQCAGASKTSAPATRGVKLPALTAAERADVERATSYYPNVLWWEEGDQRTLILGVTDTERWIIGRLEILCRDLPAARALRVVRADDREVWLGMIDCTNLSRDAIR